MLEWYIRAFISMHLLAYLFACILKSFSVLSGYAAVFISSAKSVKHCRTSYVYFRFHSSWGQTSSVCKSTFTSFDIYFCRSFVYSCCFTFPLFLSIYISSRISTNVFMMRGNWALGVSHSHSHSLILNTFRVLFATMLIW